MGGQLPFEGDTFIEKEVIRLRNKYGLRYALELGSQYGATLKWFTENFLNALGCEPNKEFYEIIKKKRLPALHLDSLTFLEQTGGAFKTERPEVFIFIDSHWHGTPCPLLEELDLIAKLEMNAIIAIHDFEVPMRPAFGYDTYQYPLTYKTIREHLPKIYPNGFKHHYNKEAEGAMRGIIYIEPEQ